jgi:molybdenum cofactor synthesis domain-containing protein
VEAAVSAEELPADARARVITVSDRSHGGLRHDESGPLLARLLTGLGFAEADVVVVPDEIPEIEAALRAAVADGVDVVATTGGTGFAPRDVTPEATRRVLDREAPGLGEALRQFNRDKVPTTILSRAVAGVAGATIIVNLPGSTGGVRDGVDVLEPVIGHAVTQLRGGDH